MGWMVGRMDGRTDRWTDGQVGHSPVTPRNPLTQPHAGLLLCPISQTSDSPKFTFKHIFMTDEMLLL